MTRGPYESNIYPPGWVQPLPFAELVHSDRADPHAADCPAGQHRTHGVCKPIPGLSEGKLNFAFLNSSSGLGDLYLKATSSGVEAAPLADCSGEDCDFKFEPTVVDGEEDLGVGSLKVKATGPCSGSADYDCCLSWISHDNANEGPGSDNIGRIAVTACSGCGTFCEWCRMRNPHTHPGLSASRSFVRLSPCKTAGIDVVADKSCSNTCMAGHNSQGVYLRNSMLGDTASYWDCRMEFLAS